MRYIKGRWIPSHGGSAAKKRFKPFICLLAAAAIIYGVISEIALSGVTQELTQQAVQHYLAESIADTVGDMSKNTADFTVISTDDSGKIVSIQADIQRLNTFKAKLTKAAAGKLNGKTRVMMPIGSFTGISVFNGRGFPIPLKMQFESSVDVEFKSELVSAGINQSCHRIYITVNASSLSQSKKFSAKESYETEFILSETVIVGEVPELMVRQ